MESSLKKCKIVSCLFLHIIKIKCIKIIIKKKDLREREILDAKVCTLHDSG